MVGVGRCLQPGYRVGEMLVAGGHCRETIAGRPQARVAAVRVPAETTIETTTQEDPMTVPIATALAVFVGVLVATQATALAPLTRQVTPVVAAFWAQLLGVAVAAVLVLVTRQTLVWPGSAAPLALVAGMCTVGIVASIGAVVAPIGIATTLAVVTGAQLLLGLVLDTLGVTGRTIPLDAGRVIGALLIVVGVLLVFGRGQQPTA